jgi:hypothetical protein
MEIAIIGAGIVGKAFGRGLAIAETVRGIHDLARDSGGNVALGFARPGTATRA